MNSAADSESGGLARPSAGTFLLGLIPFVAMGFSVPLWDRVTPKVLGLPFNLAWLLAWIVASSGCLWMAYRVEQRRGKSSASPVARPR
jgi:hypothetical protein